jgi:hypothetical protein
MVDPSVLRKEAVGMELRAALLVEVEDGKAQVATVLQLW